MEEYNIQRTLRTYSVTNQFLRQIEEHIMNKMPGLMPTSPGGDPLEGHTTLLLSGRAGAEHFTPAGNYTQQGFDNNVEKAALTFNYWVGQHADERQAFMATIRLSSYSGETDLSITLRAPAAREKVADLERSLLEKMEQNKNSNWIAYPNEIMPTLVFVLGFLAFIFTFMFANPILKTICILLFAGAFYLVTHRFMKGYCTFDSNRQKQLNAIFKLIVIAVSAFIIVSILTPLRKTLWGF